MYKKDIQTQVADGIKTAGTAAVIASTAIGAALWGFAGYGVYKFATRKKKRK